MNNEYDRPISDLENNVHTLEKQLETRMVKWQQHMCDAKTSWSDKINNLLTRILNMNQQMPEVPQESSHVEKMLANA